METEISKRVVHDGACMVIETNSDRVVRGWHSHPEYELIYIKKGGGTLKYGSAITYYEQGDLLLLGSWVPHVFIQKGNGHHSLACIFHSELLSLTHFQCTISKRVPTLLKESIKGIKFKIHDLPYFSPEVFFKSLLEKDGILQAIDTLLYLYQLIDSKVPYNYLSNNENLSDRAYFKRHDKLQKIIVHIKNNLSDDLNINYLSDIFHMSRSSLTRLFKESMQMGVSHYINKLRLTQACFLLTTTAMPITEISEKIGFQSLSSLNRNFLKFQGMTPSDYRIMHSK